MPKPILFLSDLGVRDEFVGLPRRTRNVRLEGAFVQPP